MTTVTARENEIREMAGQLHLSIGNRQVKNMARRLARKDGTLEFSEFWLVYNNADPTPAKAIRNLERNTK